MIISDNYSEGEVVGVFFFGKSMESPMLKKMTAPMTTREYHDSNPTFSSQL